MPAERLREAIRTTRALTDRPFGVNVIIDEEDDADRELILDGMRGAFVEKVAAVVLFWGDPAPYVEEAHANGVSVLIRCTWCPRRARSLLSSVATIPLPPTEA